MSQSDDPQVEDLLKTALDEGDLSQAAYTVLNVPHVATQMKAAIGASLDDEEVSETTLVIILVDDSTSIEAAANTQHIRDGVNGIFDDVLVHTKGQANMKVHVRLLNQGVLFPFVPLENAVRLDTTNYLPNGNTPLYDQSVVVIGNAVVELKRYDDFGIPARVIVLIFTDGEDVGSRNSASDVKKLIQPLLTRERYIIWGYGASNGNVDFNKVFGEMGIPDRWIMSVTPEPGESHEDFVTRQRRGFQVVSSSIVRASQNAGSYSQVALGGLGAP
jgi:hypothetical protein